MGAELLKQRRDAPAAQARGEDHAGAPRRARHGLDASPRVQALAQCRRAAQGGAHARGQARLARTLAQRRAVAQRVFDAGALAEAGIKDAPELLRQALETATGAARRLLLLARDSPRFDLRIEPRDAGPSGATSLHYRDDDERIDLEQAQRIDPLRARAGGLVMRIGVNLKRAPSEGAVLETLVHEVGVHAAPFAPHLEALLEGLEPERAADALVRELGDLGALSPSIQHILFAGGEAGDYEELVKLLGPRLGPLEPGFRSAEKEDREGHAVAARAAGLGVLLAQEEGQTVSPRLLFALAGLGFGSSVFPAPTATSSTPVAEPAPVDDISLLLGLAEAASSRRAAPSSSTSTLTTNAPPLPFGGILPPLPTLGAPRRAWSPGQEVRVIRGPFAPLRGRVVRQLGDRVSVQLELHPFPITLSEDDLA